MPKGEKRLYEFPVVGDVTKMSDDELLELRTAVRSSIDKLHPGKRLKQAQLSPFIELCNEIDRRCATSRKMRKRSSIRS